MSAQAADPRSLMYPKPSWSEQTGPHHTRFCYSFEELVLAMYYVDKATTPRQMAYADFVERELER